MVLVVVVLGVVVVVVVAPGAGGVNSTCSSGAPVVLPSRDSAVRVPPVPVKIRTIGRPLTQPATFTMSWMIAATFGVRWATPANPPGSIRRSATSPCAASGSGRRCCYPSPRTLPRCCWPDRRPSP